VTPSSAGEAATASRGARSDQARNRARIVEVASAAFRDEGLDVSMREIARRAELGVATVHRHFESRDDLIVAVVSRTLNDLEEVVDTAMEQESGEALAFLFRGKMDISMRMRGFPAAIGTRPLPAEVHEPLTAPVRAKLDQLAGKLHEAEALRPEITGADLFGLVMSVSYLADFTTDEQCARFPGVFARGLQA
jgi:AcrR family transcriptional regulator